MDEEDSRAIREGLDEESLAIFDLLRKDDLAATDIKRVKAVAVGLLETLKGKKLRVDQWREKETTRDAVRVAIRDFLWSDDTGLPVDTYSEAEVKDRRKKCTATSTAPTRPSRRRSTKGQAHKHEQASLDGVPVARRERDLDEISGA